MLREKRLTLSFDIQISGFVVYPLISTRKPLLKKLGAVTKHSRIGCLKALPKINGLPLFSHSGILIFISRSSLRGQGLESHRKAKDYDSVSVDEESNMFYKS